jgi:murein DD-endopeptidase MepM/ murein hydrolase activator NlpD
VNFGDFVKEGQEIALSGDSVSWTGPHLHFEARDLSKWELRDRPFKPHFGKGLPEQYRKEFTYVVSYPLAPIDLAIKFFGSERGLEKLREANSSLSDLSDHGVLKKGSPVIVTN